MTKNSLLTSNVYKKLGLILATFLLVTTLIMPMTAAFSFKSVASKAIDKTVDLKDSFKNSVKKTIDKVKTSTPVKKVKSAFTKNKKTTNSTSTKTTTTDTPKTIKVTQTTNTPKATFTPAAQINTSVKIPIQNEPNESEADEMYHDPMRAEINGSPNTWVFQATSSNLPVSLSPQGLQSAKYIPRGIITTAGDRESNEDTQHLVATENTAAAHKLFTINDTGLGEFSINYELTGFSDGRPEVSTSVSLKSYVKLTLLSDTGLVLGEKEYVTACYSNNAVNDLCSESGIVWLDTAIEGDTNSLTLDLQGEFGSATTGLLKVEVGSMSTDHEKPEYEFEGLSVTYSDLLAEGLEPVIPENSEN